MSPARNYKNFRSNVRALKNVFIFFFFRVGGVWEGYLTWWTFCRVIGTLLFYFELFFFSLRFSLRQVGTRRTEFQGCTIGSRLLPHSPSVFPTARPRPGTFRFRSPSARTNASPALGVPMRKVVETHVRSSYFSACPGPVCESCSIRFSNVTFLIFVFFFFFSLRQ